MKVHLCLPRLKTFYRQLWLHPSEVIKPSEVSEILAEYGLTLTGPPKHTAEIGRSRNLVVNTSGGKAILKMYKPSLTLPRVVHEHSILKHLAQVTFPAPRLLYTLTGETIVRRQESNCAMFEFIEGYIRFPHHFLIPSDALELISSAGKTLGKLHICLKDFLPEGRNPDGFRSLGGERWRNLVWYTNKLTRCIEEKAHLNERVNGVLPVFTTLSKRANWIYDTLCRLDHLLESAQLPRLIIHADYRPINLLLRKDTSTAVLDFEIARLDWRIIDLAKAIPAFAYRRPIGLNFYRMKAFLRAYQKQFIISVEELRLIPFVWQFLLLRRVIVCWHNYCVGHSDTAVNEIQQHLKLLDWIISHENKMIAQLDVP